MATYSGTYTSTLVVTNATPILTGTITVAAGVALDATNPPQTVQIAAGALVVDSSFGPGDTGINLQAGDTLLNAGFIQGGGVGVKIAGGGYVSNASTGYIRGNSNYGLLVTGAAGTLLNAGRVAVTGGYGVYFEAGGSVTDLASSQVSGRDYGIRIVGATGTVTNAGIVQGSVAGVALVSGAVTNQSGGSISSFPHTPAAGTGYGVQIAGNGSVDNTGVIGHVGNYTGVLTKGVAIGGTGNVTNHVGGTIVGDAFGVSFSGSGIVNNQGSILGAVKLPGSGAFFNLAGANLTAGNVNGVPPANNIAVTIGSGAASQVDNYGQIFNGMVSVTGGAVVAGTTVTGYVFNRTGGLIHGNDLAVAVTNGGVNNGGTIIAVGLSGHGDGVHIAGDGGRLINVSGGTHALISAVSTAVAMSGVNLAVQNAGTIHGGVAGMSLSGGGYLTNQSGGYISGGSYLGLVLAPGTAGTANFTIRNDGTIRSGVTVAVGSGSIVSIYNNSGGLLTGFPAVSAASQATVHNAGSMTGDATLAGGGFFSNTGTVKFGNVNGVVMGAGGVISNGAVISGNVHGAMLTAGGYLANNAGAIVYGTTAVSAAGANATITNRGTIQAPSGNLGVLATGTGFTLSNTGVVNGIVQLQAGGKVVNVIPGGGLTGGTIDGGVTVSGNAGTVLNAGMIGTDFGATYGVQLQAGGRVVNGVGGTITGHTGVTISSDNSTLQNYGSIKGSFGTAVQASGANDVVQLAPFYQFTGTVTGNSTGTLELQSFAAMGTVGGISTEFVGFGTVQVDTGAHWQLTGSNTLTSGQQLLIQSGATLSITGSGGVFQAGSTLTKVGLLSLISDNVNDSGVVVNNGTIIVDPSTLTVGALTGTGTLDIDTGSSVTTTGSVSSGQTIAFIGTSGQLQINDLADFGGTIKGFGQGETIAFGGGTTVSSGSIVSGHTLHLSLSGGGSIDLQLDPAVDYSGTTLDFTGGVASALCFCIDTFIATPGGQVKVQDLAVGDMVITASGTVRPIAWIGTGQVLATRGKRGAATPVIVRRGALGPNVPYQDLRVTKGHAFHIDDALIPVEFLVNHRTIEWDDRAQEVKLFHIELETHDVLVANGAPAESYRDDGNRWLFHNANSGWDQPAKEPCAPVLTGGPAVDAAWRRLLDRAGPRRRAPMTEDADLHLIADGVRLDAVSHAGDSFVFRLPAIPESLRIASRSAVPQELGLARDARLLGVAVRQIAARKGTRFRTMAARDTALSPGFHDFEADNGFRWTDGDAAVPPSLLSGFGGSVEVVVQIAMTTVYWDDGQACRVVA